MVLETEFGEPIRSECMHCGVYIRGARKSKIVSHGVCDRCLERHYPDFGEEVEWARGALRVLAVVCAFVGFGLLYAAVRVWW